MGTGDADNMLASEHLVGKPLRPRNVALSPVEDRLHQGIAARDYIADYPKVGREAQLLGAKALDQLDAERRELLAHRRIDVRVAPCYAIARALGNGRETAHEGAADSEDMQMCGHGEGGILCEALGYDSAVKRSARQTGMRARIAAAAARIMAEDGVDDFALAKRKAARQLGAQATQALPANDEVEAELRAYRALYQADEHPERIAELRRIALDAMRTLERFSPYLTGPVLKGIAGPYAEIELQLFPESTKELEIYLLERNIAFTTHEGRRYSGDQTRAMSVLQLSWQGAPLRLSVFDPRDERLALKTSPAGRALDRAGIAEVGALLREPGAA